MSKVTVTESYLEDIGDAIREKLNTSQGYTPGQMAAAIQAIPTGGITPTGTISITQNGAHDVTQYASANVNVQPNLQSKTVTENGTVTPDQGYDGLSSVVVNVPGGGSDTRTLLAEWDFTGESPLIDKIGGKTLTNVGVTFSSSGAYFRQNDSSAEYGLSRGIRLYIMLSDLLSSGTLAGCDIEIDVGEWQKWALKSSDAARLLMVNRTNGIGYRQTGNRSSSGWNIYDNAWTNSNIISTMIDFSTVKLSLASNESEYDTVYVNGNKVIMDNTTGNRLASNISFIMLGGPDNTETTGVVETSVGGIYFKGMRIYRR